jgi:ubiquinone/menaquinone biosynthesis C-methylase UbiE
MRHLPRLAALLVVLAPFPTLAQDTPKKAPDDINKQFESPDLDVESFVKRFESESREVFAKRHEIVAFVGPKEGMAIADVGAGTGLFTRLFAEKVGPDGKVYAVDISPKFLEHIKRESERLGLKHVTTVRGGQDSTKLPKESVDVVFLADVYHHFEKPDRMLASIREALKPGGRFVIVEFDRASAKNASFIKSHVRADKETFLKEIEGAGFEPIASPEAPDLEGNFVAAFRKPAKSGDSGR